MMKPIPNAMLNAQIGAAVIVLGVSLGVLSAGNRGGNDQR